MDDARTLTFTSPGPGSGDATSASFRASMPLLETICQARMRLSAKILSLPSRHDSLAAMG